MGAGIYHFLAWCLATTYFTFNFLGMFVYNNNITKKIIFVERTGFNNLCIPEKFNTNISHQLFDYTNSTKGDFVLKTGFKDFLYTKINLTPIWYDKFN